MWKFEHVGQLGGWSNFLGVPAVGGYHRYPLCFSARVYARFTSKSSVWGVVSEGLFMRYLGFVVYEFGELY